MAKLLLALLTLASITLAAPPAPIENRAVAPTVAIPSPAATVIGSSTGKLESFSGIPFAQPPVGKLRLKPPQPLTTSLGTVKAVDSDAEFPTGVLGTVLNTPVFQTATNAKEDCLTINVIRPVGVGKGSKLPVLFWIYGGGFELGSTAMYDGSSLVQESINTNKPIIFVAVNYRVGGFGFMPGAEILKDGSSNLGLLDQRLGLHWTADNIAEFGGGESTLLMRKMLWLIVNFKTPTKSPYGENQLEVSVYLITWL
jgi:carboxylesterase type B